MIRIVFLARSLEQGGAERQLVTLVRGLDKRQFDPAVVCFYGEGPLEAELTAADVPVFVVGKRSRWDLLSFASRLVELLRSLHPDVLHSYLEVPNIVAALAKPFLSGAPVVWGVRNCNVDLSGYDWFVRASYGLSARLSGCAALTIVNSNSGRAYYTSHGYSKTRTICIPNGIDTDRYCPSSEMRGRVRAIWGVPEDELLIGLVARLDLVKDHSTFLRAASMVARERKDVRFVCIGDGPGEYRARLEQLAGEVGLNGRLLWVGQCDDMPAAYCALDILCSASTSEAFSNVIGEAMASQVPCVVTDVGDSSVVVGDTGVVVPTGDPEALSIGLLRVLSEGIDGIQSRGSDARRPAGASPAPGAPHTLLGGHRFHVCRQCDASGIQSSADRLVGPFVEGPLPVPGDDHPDHLRDRRLQRQ